MKKQLAQLKAGEIFFFGNNTDLKCMVTYNSGKTLRYTSPRLNGKEVIYGKMPAICEGHLVTVIN